MRADAREKRAILIDTARRLFADQGPDVSLRAIAAAAQVGIGTLYRHFPTREDLQVAVIGTLADSVIAVIERYDHGWDTPEQAEATWRACGHALADLQLAAVGVAIFGSLSEDSGVLEATESYRRSLSAAYSALLERAEKAGLVESGLSVWRFHLGLAAVARPLPDRVEDIAPAQTTWLVDTFLSGLRPNAAESVHPPTAPRQVT